MVRKTRKQYSSKTNGVHTIPELRRSFEYIEDFIDEKLQHNETKEKLIRDLRKEWLRIFLKDLDKKSAEAFIEDRMDNKKTKRHRTLRRKGGAGSQLPNTSTPVTGAPLDYTTRAGVYLAPGQIPDENGHLPLSTGGGGFGSYIQYVSSGFRNPEQGISYDPVPGQTSWPIPMKDTGDNTVNFSSKGGARRTQKTKGARRTHKLKRRGGTRLLPSSSSPPNPLKDAEDAWYGLHHQGPSPNPVQR